MANMNKIFIAGQLGQDVELKYAGKTPVINLSIATSDEWVDDKAKVHKNTDWHKVTYFGNHAKSLVEKLNLAKGDSLLIEGSMHYSSYEKEGIDIPTAKIKAEKVQLLRRVEKVSEKAKVKKIK